MLNGMVLNGMMLNDTTINRLLETKEITSLDELKQLTVYFTQKGVDVSQILETLEKYEIEFEIKGVKIEEIVRILVAINPPSKKERQEEFEIYESEARYLQSVKNEADRKILFLLLAISKYDNHPTGWIKYNRDLLFNFWGLKLTNPQKSEVIKRCCDNGAMDLRVIGSKNPIVCFKVNFRSYDFANVVAKLRFEDNSITDFYDSYLYGENE
nr:MAG TPA: protein of unknown function (DUF5401) [Caudoviricetes sp.]